MFFVLAVGICLVVSSKIGSVKLSATVQRSSVVLIGDRVELKCSVIVDDVVSWRYTSWNSSTETSIYLGRDVIVASMKARFKIDKRISGQHNLIVDSVDLAHAGRYRCTGLKHSSPMNDIQLIVFGSNPVCYGNTNEADVTRNEQKRLHLSIWCSINYTGNGFPVFIWTKSNTENLSSNATNSSTGQVPFTSTSLITQQLQANDTGVTFYCIITFQTPNISPENAFNGFEYTWNYTLYGPKNLNIVEYGDHLKCSADANPIPIYRWTEDEANISINGSVYALTLINDKENTVYCAAGNIFASVSTNYTIKGRTKYSDVTSDVSSSLVGLTTPAIAGSISVLLIIGLLIIFACVVCRKRLKGDSRVRPDVALNTDLTSYGSDGRMISDNAVYADVCKPTGSDNAVCTDVCKTKGVRHGDSKSRAAAIQMAHSTRKYPRITAINEYCSITDRSSTSEKPQLYCELSFTDQPRADYINPPLAEQKVPNAEAIYSEITDLH